MGIRDAAMTIGNETSEPMAVTVDGREFRADPAEKRDFEAALARAEARVGVIPANAVAPITAA